LLDTATSSGGVYLTPIFPFADGASLQTFHAFETSVCDSFG
jgi:hypothetical protein